MNKIINISSNGIKQAIDDLVNENEMLQDKVYKLESIIKEVRELRKKISNLYYEDGFDLDTPMLLKYIDEILDKENKDNIWQKNNL